MSSILPKMATVFFHSLNICTTGSTSGSIYLRLAILLEFLSHWECYFPMYGAHLACSSINQATLDDLAAVASPVQYVNASEFAGPAATVLHTRIYIYFPNIFDESYIRTYSSVAVPLSMPDTVTCIQVVWTPAKEFTQKLHEAIVDQGDVKEVQHYCPLLPIGSHSFWHPHHDTTELFDNINKAIALRYQDTSVIDTQMIGADATQHQNPARSAQVGHATEAHVTNEEVHGRAIPTEGV